MRNKSSGTKKKAVRLFDLTLTGQLALDLVNTVDWRTSEEPQELLDSYSDLLRWARHTGILAESEASRLLRLAGRHPVAAQAALDEAKELREAFFRIFAALAANEQPTKSDLELLNARLSAALAHLQLATSGAGFTWQWANADNRLDAMLWAVVRAAGELLVNPEALEQLRQCPGAGCGWLFLDTSRNRSRRWCLMGICGNRAKARRHYQQIRSVRGK